MCVPRVGGGDRMSDHLALVVNACSPRVRGLSVAVLGNTLIAQVFPACAGVIGVIPVHEQIDVGVPRVSGGDRESPERLFHSRTVFPA